MVDFNDDIREVKKWLLPTKCRSTSEGYNHKPDLLNQKGKPSLFQSADHVCKHCRLDHW